MRIIVPKNYAAFHCVAGACMHTCCKGWEIDIDPGSARRYARETGRIGEKLRHCIQKDADGAHFILDKDERCPFLQADGLCEMILSLGEGALCQICTDHPRFRNFFSDRTEMGLGLCCEEAARLTLYDTQKMQLVILTDDNAAEVQDADEQALLTLRARLIDAVQDRALPMQDRLCHMLSLCGASAPEKSMAEWADILLELEILDPAWAKLLHALKKAPPTRALTLPELPAEQFIVYLLYRHLPEALNDGNIAARAAFAVFGVLLLDVLCFVKQKSDPETVIDLARMFSSEIEYSSENMDALIDILSDK